MERRGRRAPAAELRDDTSKLAEGHPRATTLRRLRTSGRDEAIRGRAGGMGKEELAVVRKEKLAGVGEDKLAGRKDELG